MGGGTRDIGGLGERAFAVIASLMILLASPGLAGAVTLQGGTSTVDDAGESPDVSVPNTTIDDASDSTVGVAYNVTGVLAANETGVRLTGPAGLSVANLSLGSTEGVATLTIPADVYGGGNLTVSATAVDTSTGTPVANDSATLSVVSNATVSGFALSSTEVGTGENVTVSAVAENVGGAAADVTVALYEDGMPVDSTRITVAAGGNETVTFDRSYPSAGTHSLSVNTLPERTVNVTESTGSVYVSGYVVPKRTVNVSESFPVNATVTNTKSTAANATVDLYENGTLVETRIASVPAGSNETVPFLAGFGTAGDHTVTVNGAPSTNVTVLADDVGSANLSVVDYTVSKTSLNVSENVDVEATVENSGTETDSMWVDFYRDGLIVDSRNVTVGAGNFTTVAFSTNFSISGTHSVNVTDQSPTSVEVMEGSGTDGSSSSPDQWLQFQYDRENTGHNPSAVGPKRNRVVSWQFSAPGPAYSQPLVYGNLALFTSATEVYAVDARTGVEHWNTTLNASAGHIDTVGVSGDELYVQNRNGTVFVLDLSTGGEIRNFTISGSAETIVGGHIYTTEGTRDYGRVAAINASTGVPAWSTSTSTDIVDGLAVANGTVYVGQLGDPATMHAINASTGDIVWSTPIQVQGDPDWSASLAVAEGRLYFGMVNQRSVFALDAANGTELWQANFTGYGRTVDQSPIVVDGTVYVGNQVGDFKALNASTGAERWNLSVGSRIESSGAFADGVVYFGTDDDGRSNPGTVYAADAATGELLWDLYIGDRTSSLAVVDNSLYVANGQLGDLYAISGSKTLPRNVSVVNSSISDTSVNTSEDVIVNATVRNTGNRAEWVRIDLFTDSEFSTAHETFVSGGSTETVTFATNFSDTGTHSVNVTDSSPILVNVTSNSSDGNGSANLSVDGYTLSKNPVNVSESFWVNATVSNSGDAEGSMIVELYHDGQPWDGREVVVSANTTTEVPFLTNFSTSGNHTVNVTDRSPTLVEVFGGSDGDGGSTNLTVVEYTVSKNPVNASESFWVNATVANGGDIEGSMWVDLYQDGWIVDGTEVTVAPNATATASFRTNFTASGNHTVNVTGQVPTTVEVLDGTGGDGDGSNVTVDYAVSATSVNVSESFWVNATVHNAGANDTTETVTLYADGSPVDSATVNVSAGTSETVPFSHSFSTDGSHSVSVDGLEPTAIDVQGDGGDTASIVVTDMDVSKWHVDTNETVTVSATVENRGSASGTKTVELWVASAPTGTSRTVTLDAGNSTTVSFERSFDTTGNWPVNVTGWAEHIVEVSDGGPSGPHVVTGDVTHVGGTTPDMSQVVLSGSYTGMFQVQLQNGTADGSDLNETYDLDGIGVDKSTRFRIDVRLNGSVPRLLLGNGRNVSWTRSRNPDGTWNVSIYARGSHVESIFDRSTSPWPEGENDTADTFHNVSVSLAIDSLDVFSESKQQAMNGTVFATDAQQFSSPEYTPPASGQPAELSLYVAGPHYGVNGSTNTGYFDAFIPDPVLSEWNVSEPSELAGSYQGAQSAITAWSVPGGMRVELDIHYSDGDVAIVRSSDTATGLLNGTVTNGSAAPVAGATVTVRNASTGQTAATATTDANGNYSTSLTNGTYNVTASASGYDDATASGLPVTAGSTTVADLTLAASSTGTLSGTVLNGSDDTAIEGVSVSVSNGSGTVATATTDAQGAFDVSLAEGSYDVSLSADGYVSKSLSGVPVTAGQTTSFTARLSPDSGGSGSTGFVNGTVTNASGSPVSGATVTAYGPTGVQTTTTDASGNYSVAVAPDLIGLEYNATGYGVVSEFVEVTADNTTRVDVTLREPGTIEGVIRDENGDPIPGATVDVWGPSSARTTTETDGSYSVSVGAGDYVVEVRASGYAQRVFRDVRVNASGTTARNATLRSPGFITGTVRDADGNPLGNVWVGAEDGSRFADNVTLSDGSFNISAAPGNYTVTGFGPNGGMVSASGTVQVTEGTTTDLGTLTTVNPTVLGSEVSHVGGTRPDMANVSVNARTFGGMLMVQLTNASGANRGMPVDLTDLGVDNTTRFEITLTVEDYDPSALLWGARNVSWSATPNGTNPNATDITVRTNTVHLAGIDDQSLPIGPITRQSPDDVRWPTGAQDRADLGWNETVYVMLYDLGSMPVEVSSSLENMTVVTNAQTFSRPQIVNGTLRVYAAGPHYTEEGVVHDGFYSAFVPNAQLDDWNVTDPKTELEASWKGGAESFTVEVTPDGAWIHLDINYSDGYAEVSAVDATDPTADAGSNRTVDEDTSVTFDGSNSTDNVGVESYSWEFGDGNTSTGMTPTHTYADPGTYTVNLTVADAAGNTDTDTLTVTVTDTTAPVAEAGADRTVDEDTYVTFDGSNSTDNGDIASYEWQFGDGTTATGVSPSHTYADPDTLTVTLTVTDAAGNVDTDTLIVTINDTTVPTAEAGPNVSVDEDTSVTFNGSESTDNGITTLTWEFGDGSTPTTGTSPTHTYTDPGTYTVTLNVTDDAGNWDTDSLVVTVNDTTAPVAEAGANRTVDEDTSVTFDGSNATDNDAIDTYSWAFGDGATATGVSPTHTYAEPGTYTVTLNVTDSAGNWDTDTLTITVSDVTSPTAEAGPDRTSGVGVSMEFDGSNATDNVDVDSYSWEFGDGSNATGVSASHAYATPGTYTVTLTVTDAAGNSDSDTATVTINDTTAPTADAGANRTVDEDVSVSFDGSNATDNVGIDAYSWDLGDGSSATGVAPSHTYAEPGTYVVTLTVSDAAGNTDADTLTVTVNDTTAPTAEAGPSATVDEDASLTFDGSNSTDGVGIVSYSWAFGDGNTSAGVAPTHTYAEPGTYTVTLTVADAAGNSDTDRLDVTVSDTTTPTADAGGNRTVEEDTTVSFDGSNATDNVGVESYSWAFGDGNTSAGVAPTHTYTEPGTYTVTLNVTDAAGNWDTDSLVVTVADATAPTAEAGSDRTATEGSAIDFDGSASADNAGVDSYSWDFGDGTNATGATPIHTYAEPGTYTVSLTVADAAGNADTDTLTVTVETAGSGGDSDGGDDDSDGSDDGTTVPDDGTTDPIEDGNTTDATNETDTTNTTDDANGTDAVEDPVVESTSTANVSAATDGNRTTVNVSGATANETVSVRLNDVNRSVERSGGGVEAINTTFDRDGDFDMNVSYSAERPDAEDAGESVDGVVPDRTVGYVSVQHAADDAVLRDVTFTVRVGVDRIAERGVEPSAVALYRFHDGAWMELDTTLLGEENGHYRFRAVSPGLSVFAIAQRGTAEPDIDAVSASTDASTVAADDTVTVSATVENTGSSAGEATLRLAVDGEPAVTRSVSLAPGERTTVDFEYVPTDAGTYRLSVEGLDAGTIEVVEADAATTPEPTATTTPSPTEAATGTADGGTTVDATAETPAETSSGSGAGFGPALAIVALLAAGLLANRRQRDR